MNIPETQPKGKKIKAAKEAKPEGSKQAEPSPEEAKSAELKGEEAKASTKTPSQADLFFDHLQLQ